MSSDQPRPPVLAAWLLRHLCSTKDQEVLTGDLLERFGEGESDGWFWRQVLIAIFVGAARELRVHRPQLLFSITGSAFLWFWGGRFLGRILESPTIAKVWDWRLDLEWPVSALYDLGFRSFVAVLLILPILAALLLLDREFRWVSLLRTLLLSIPLIAANVAAFELWFSPGFGFTVIFVSLILCTLLVSAWVGCQTVPGPPISGDKVFVWIKPAITALGVMCLLHAMSGMGNGSWWVLDQLNRPFAGSYNSGWIWSRCIIPAEIFILSGVCTWIACRLNRGYRRAMLVMVLIWWVLLFGYPTSSYWSGIVSDSIDHPWFRSYLGDFVARCFSVVAGTLVGGVWRAPHEGARFSRYSAT